MEQRDNSVKRIDANNQPEVKLNSFFYHWMLTAMSRL
jgi:hypothetical protein